MKNFKHKQGGYAGLISLLIVVALSAVLLVMALRSSTGGSEQNTVEEGTSAIQEAEEAKALLENQNRTTMP